MKTKKVRITSLFLVCLLVLSLFSGCGKKAPTNTDVKKDPPASSNETKKDEEKPAESESTVPDYMNATGLPITKEKITVKVLGQKDPGATEWGDLELFKKVEEMTNIHFEFELAEPSTYVEKKNLALASGEYPDVIMREATINDEDTYGPQGVFINLKPLIEQYAPNLTKRLEEHPDMKAAITAMDGNIYGLPYYMQTSTMNPHLAFFDTQWLENVGMDMPVTTDDLYDLLKAFKEKDANGNGDPSDEIPWSGAGLTSLNGFILPAFTGLSGGATFDIKDSKVVFAPTLPEFKEYLAYINKLYKDGLIDPEMLTQTSQQALAKAKSGTVGIYNVSPTNLPPETTSLQDCLEPLISATNKEKVTRAYSPVYTGRGIITDKAKHPEALMRWFDLWYAKDDEGIEGLNGNTLFVGLENVHWEYASADKKTYKFIEPITGFADINASVSVNMHMPSYLNFLAYPSDFPLMEMKVKAVQGRQEPYMKTFYPRNVRYTEAEHERASLLETDINSYVEQMIAKFLIGDEPIDNFDKFVSTLESMNLNELLKIKQDVYDRWLAASK